MKRFFCKLTALLVLAALPFVAYFFWVQSLPNMYAGSIMGAVRMKLTALQETAGPRIILVGGSSAPYGIASEPVAEAFGMPCLNMGATAYLGMDFYLAQLKGELHEGDIVIIAPEFAMYKNTVDYSVVWMAVENHVPSLKKLPLHYWPKLLGNYHIYATAKRDRLATEAPHTGTLAENYTAYGFGPFGDLTTGHPANILEKKYNSEDTMEVSTATADAAVLASLRRFGAYAKGKGAQVHLTYAPFNRLALTSDPALLTPLQARIEAETGLPFLGSLPEGIMDENLFFDSNNHLTQAGQQQRTQALIHDLAKALKK